MAPLSFKIAAQCPGIEPIQPRQHVRVAAIMIGEVEGLWIGLAQHFALVERDLAEHNAGVLVAQAREELAERLEGGMAVGGPLFRFGEGQHHLAKLVWRHRRHPVNRYATGMH